LAFVACQRPTGHQPSATAPRRRVHRSNVSDDISTSDIAAALHVAPRTLQYLFRRHLDTTPRAYLRRTRLAYAHRDLIAADNATETVAAIAARWGFAHPGRFSVQYRQMYGHSPRATLKC
jgi:transcriptional regulator GlxA family with amidase domain